MNDIKEVIDIAFELCVIVGAFLFFRYIKMNFDALKTSLSTLGSDFDAFATDVKADLSALKTEIQNLTAGGTVSQDQIDGLTNMVSAIDAKVTAADADVKADLGAGTPPAGGGGAPGN